MKTLLLALFVAVSAIPALAEDLAIEAEVIHTMAGKAIRNGVILIHDGKIERVEAWLEEQRAAATARSTSSGVPSGTLPITCSVVESITSIRPSPDDSTHSPPI